MSQFDRLLRLNQVLAIIPISKSGWWLGIRNGILPRPIKIGRASLWKYSDIEKLISTLDCDERQRVQGSLASKPIETFSDDSKTGAIQGGAR